jgi:translin
MSDLESIGERIREYLEAKNEARERALRLCRTVIRHASVAIRSIHRHEAENARERLRQARELVEGLEKDLASYPDLYHAGYTRDARKEYAEAEITCALLLGQGLPDPEDLGVDYTDYLGGLADSAGELRRQALDLLREDRVGEAERLLEAMDDIYGLLVTLDFPDALTGNLRRATDMVRGVTERTRGDMTTASQQLKLKAALRDVEKKIGQS